MLEIPSKYKSEKLIIVWGEKLEQTKKTIKDYSNGEVISFELKWKSQSLENSSRLLSMFSSQKINLNIDDKLYLFLFDREERDEKSFVIIKDRLFHNQLWINDLLLLLPEKSIFLFQKEDTNAFKNIISDGYEFFGKTLTLDLKGNNGWKSLSELFSTLNVCCDYVVLRNHEELNDNYKFLDDDIDMLTSNIDRLVAVMNCAKRKGGRCSYEIKVNDILIPLDLRFIGDKYFDSLWQRDMLANKNFKKNIFILNDIDYFFSLLYHIKLQKFFVKKVYPDRLLQLSSKIFLKIDKEDFIADDKYCSDLINGFFKINNYRYTFTDDARRNSNFLKLISNKEINDLNENWRELIKNLFFTICKKIMVKIKSFFIK